MSTIMQKAVTPAFSHAYLTQGYDRIAGFVSPADSVAWADTVGSIFEAHGLGFPGSPFSSDAAFIDRAPFTGLGFANVVGRMVPVHWLVHSRVPAGSELIRIKRGGMQILLGRYVDVATGWHTIEPPVSNLPVPSRYVGPLATWGGEVYPADVLGDQVVLAAQGPVSGAEFVPTAAGRWRLEVPRSQVTEVVEMYVTARWNGLEVRVVDSGRGASGEGLARVSYIGHNADLAEGLNMSKVDAGVYEATVPSASLENLTTAQLVPPAWR